MNTFSLKLYANIGQFIADKELYKKKQSRDFFYFLICSCPVNLHSICEKKLGCHELIFFATELKVKGYVFCFFIKMKGQ